MRIEKVLVRPATIEDIPRLLVIERETTHAAHWAEEKYFEMFENPTLGRFAVIVEDESGIHGFGVAQLVHQDCEIENVAVAFGMLRRGVGTQLLRELIRWGRQQGAITFFLEVREKNEAARALYGGFGFSECGLRQGYYRDPEDNAIRYSL